jgi:hypothetical protein
MEHRQSLLNAQKNYYVDPNSLQIVQKGQISESNRSMLVDWLQGVCSEVGFRRETFHLAFLYVDLYLSKQYQPVCDLQLLGLTCLYISMKIEEIHHIDVHSFVIFGNKFSRIQILEKEREILQVLRWKIYPDTLNGWLDSYIN